MKHSNSILMKDRPGGNVNVRLAGKLNLLEALLLERVNHVVVLEIEVMN